MPPRAFFRLGFYIFIVLKGRKRCGNVFRASSVSSTEMNYSLWAIANRQAPAIASLFFLFKAGLL